MVASILRPFSNSAFPGKLQVPISAGYRIDWTHNLANGLIGYFLPGMVAGNLVNADQLAVNIGNGFTARALGPYGPESQFTGAVQAAGRQGGWNLATPVIANSGGVNWTIAGLAMVPVSDGAATNGAPLYGERAAAGNDIFKLDYNHASSPNPHNYEIVIRDDSGTLLKVTTSAGYNDGLYHNLAATKNGNGGGSNVLFYVDAVQVANGSWTGTDSYTDAGLDAVIGATDNQDTSGSWPGSIVYVGLWNRVLSPLEVWQLSVAPFDLIVSAEGDMPALFVAAAQTFQPAWAMRQRIVVDGIGI